MREEPELGAVSREIDQDEADGKDGARLTRQKRSPEKLLELARGEDAAHRAAHQKPISADTLRVRLGIGAAQARQLVKAVRSEFQARAEGRQQLASVPRDTKRAEPAAA
jgi:hypothetical protein